MVILFFIIVCLVLPSLSSADDWEFDDVYCEELLFLHTLVNYDYDPDWKQNWEKELMKGNGVRFNFGSVTEKKLLHYEDVIINQNLGRGWWFRSIISWNYSRFRDTDENTRYLEFQKSITKNLFMGISADVQSKKEEIDGTFSILRVNQTREAYCQIHFCWDDLVYDARNYQGGKTAHQPFGVKWVSRFEGANWIFFTDGKLSRGFKRDFPDQDKSPDISHHRQQVNNVHGKITRFLTQKSRIEAEFSHYDFDENRLFRNSHDNYSYSNTISHFTLRYIIPFYIIDQLYCEIHHLDQNAHANGYKYYRYRRNEYLPALIAKRTFSNHTLKLGYCSSLYDWDYDDQSETNDYKKNDYIDKISFGWMYHFNEKASILLSISHVVSLYHFGGGNVQYMMIL